MEDQQKPQMEMEQGIEKLGAALGAVAPIVAAYHTRLREDGVPERSAIMLTTEMQDRVLSLFLTPSVAGSAR